MPMTFTPDQRRQWLQRYSIPEPTGFTGVRAHLMAREASRWPIYRLLLASDLLCTLQAQPLDRLQFKGHAVIVEDAPQVDLRTAWQAPQFRQKFELRCDNG